MNIPLYRIGHRRGLLSILLALLLVTSFGCERTPEDLEQWRTAKGGMQKMEEWATSPEQPEDVRVRAFEILIEENQISQLKPTLEAVEDESLRARMVSSSVPIVEKMWAAKDYPVTSEADEGKSAKKVSGSKSVIAKDAAFFLVPFASGADKEKLQNILKEWMSEDWFLRNQLGKSMGQIATRAGEAGNESLLVWLKEAQDPGTVATMIARDSDDDIKAKSALIIVDRANEAHPDLDPSLLGALIALESNETVPYLKKAIADPKSSKKLIGSSMSSLVRVQGERASPFFSDLITKRNGLIRWVSATNIVEIMGKSGFTFVSTALPVEMDTYPGADSSELKGNITYFCKMYKGEMDKKGASSVSNEISKGLQSSRWPARVLALECAKTFKSNDLIEQVNELKSNKQQVPGWGEKTTVGDIANEVAADLSKS